MTPSSGIHFRHVSGNSPEKPFPAANGSGLAALDYDLDGAWTCTLPPARRFRWTAPARSRPTGCIANRGDWQFEDVTLAAGCGHNGFSAGLAVGDYDSDGFPTCTSRASVPIACCTTRGTARLRGSRSRRG